MLSIQDEAEKLISFSFSIEKTLPVRAGRVMFLIQKKFGI